MDDITGKLTVFFEEPFWTGVFELMANGKLCVCKVTFGAEPTEADLHEFVLNHYDQLKFSQSVDFKKRKTPKNPKRRQREAGKTMELTGIGTKSQQALQMMREEMKSSRKQNKREQTLEEKQRKFDMKQLKRKEKHKGH